MSRERFVITLTAMVGAAGLTFSQTVTAASERAAATEAVVIRDAIIIDTDAGTLLEHRSVVIRNGIIGDIIASEGAEPIPAAKVVDAGGKYLMAGLVDGHAHLYTERAMRDALKRGVIKLGDPTFRFGPAHSYDRRILLQFLLAGVTTVATFGSAVPGTGDDLELRDMVARGEMLGPTLFVGDLIDGPRHRDATTQSSVDKPATAADGKARVVRAKAQGYDFIKPYTFLNRETYLSVVNTAHELGYKAVGHLPELGCADCISRSEAFGTPMDGVAHLEELAKYAFPSNLSVADITALADSAQRAKQSVITTLVTMRNIVHMYAYRTVPLPRARDLRYVDSLSLALWLGSHNRYLTPAFRDQPEAPMFPAEYDFERMLARELWHKGVPLVVGTDATVPGVAYGFSVPEEMIELNKVGLSPNEVLKAATRTAFALFGLKDRTGTVTKGQPADLLLLNSNPLEYVGNVRDIAGVVVRGHWLSAKVLARMADEELPYYRRLDRALGVHLAGLRDGTACGTRQ